jgi:nicotinate-nucleotide pyrophosphorylase (carboxylating)
MDWNSHDIDELIRRALAEDVGSGDVTSMATIPATAFAQARIIAKASMVCAGLPLARKTTPGLRMLEKYAVRMGGGSNHRIGLYDAILLKENHIALAGGVAAALGQAHAYASSQMKPQETTAYEAIAGPGPDSSIRSLPVQIEVRDEVELRDALEAGAESVLLDNMTPEAAGRCVRLSRSLRRNCVVEISGGITLENARAYAETGADFLSSGSLTHSAPAADLSLLVDSIEGK